MTGQSRKTAELLTPNDLAHALFHLRNAAAGWQNAHAFCLSNASDPETTEYMRLKAEQGASVVKRFEAALRARGGDPSHDAVCKAIRVAKANSPTPVL